MDNVFTHLLLTFMLGILFCIILPEFILFTVRKIIRLLGKHLDI